MLVLVNKTMNNYFSFTLNGSSQNLTNQHMYLIQLKLNSISDVVPFQNYNIQSSGKTFHYISEHGCGDLPS